MVRPYSAVTTAARTTHVGVGVTAEDLQQVQQGNYNTRNKARRTHAESAADLTASTPAQISENSSMLKRQISSLLLFVYLVCT